MSITTEQLQALSGRGHVYAGSEKVGGIGQVYLDDATGQPSWVTVKTGLFGTSQSFVPVQDAEVRGDDLVVSYGEDQIKGAPRVDDDGSISPEEEDRLYEYYGLGSGTTGTSDVTTGTTDATTTGTTGLAGVTGTDDVDRSRTENEHGTVGRDTSGPTTDDAMTRSEERVDVGTQTREAGRARLRKYVTTETVTQSVPVSHQEVTLEREPITDANAGDAYDGPAISEEEHEVVLHEEVPVVEKEAVAVERVKLGTETVTDETQVSADVRKEHIELEDDGTTTRGTDADRR
ncbi:conserved domain-containing protein [Microlunatus sagamiharensis]|uniref:Conserved domain-containing protein n=1 Tax=Microlunatus sagamiharensis TaxID=546874 RepID=A0A1H2NC43_9ACTN|nr:YsnF/AvaK domain-containing protein [Microlunatus sagamiharensis]SDV02878.1 conserved domain-containing protein [Microlunatus sagamiharensis]